MNDPVDRPSTLHWRRGTFLVLGAGVLLLLAAFAVRSAVPIFLALPLLVAPFASALAGPRRTLTADLVWTSYGSGPDLRVAGALRPAPGDDLSDVTVLAHPPGDVREVAPPRVVRAGPGIAFDLSWQVPHPMLGSIDPPEVFWEDPLGLVTRDIAGDRSPLPFERYPPELTRLGAVRFERTLLLPGEAPTRRIGPSGEFFGIRDAAPGDPPRRINWRATARWGRPLANEYQMDRTGDVVLLVDTRPSFLGSAADEALLAVSRAAAAGIADAFLRAKARVGYAAFGEFVDATPLSSGRGHRLRLHQAIAATRRSTIAGPSERCGATFGRFFPPGVSTILISSLYGAAEPELILYLRRRGFRSVVLSPSALSLMAPAAGHAQALDALADRIERLDRRRRLGRLWADAPIVDWTDFWNLSELVNLLRQPARRRAG
ncbi:MAG TPA: DUF58 domain-containing protein [Thermoplasmata archaeon]|nr:DUF58 domain-containing protein [Thermoplasmata archaeon]